MSQVRQVPKAVSRQSCFWPANSNFESQRDRELKGSSPFNLNDDGIAFVNTLDDLFHVGWTTAILVENTTRAGD